MPRAIAAVLVVAGLVASACGSPPFDPTGPCTADGSAAGAFPEIEALVPATFRGGSPGSLDSGRTCTPEGLGTLAGHGITELRFAGGTWETGTSSGVSLAVFDVPGLAAGGLDPAWVAEFYEAGARRGRNVESVETGDYAVGEEGSGRRVDALNGESFQTVVVLERDGRIVVALIGSFIREIGTREAHEAVVREAVDAIAAG
jgi:hypothetical protein